MTKVQESYSDHERFSELCALAMSGSLTHHEEADLKQHLQNCSDCRDEYERYLLLTREGMPLLAQRYVGQEQTGVGEQSSANSHREQALFARIARAEQFEVLSSESRLSAFFPVWRTVVGPYARSLVAACLLIAASFGIYRFVVSTGEVPKQVKSRAELQVEALTAEERTLGDQLDIQAQKLAQLESDGVRKRREMERLQAELRAANQRSGELASAMDTAKVGAGEQLRSVTQQRDALSGQLRDLQQAYQAAQAELVSLRSERESTALRLASLETENTALVASSRDQERQLRNQEQYLASDRDIRELMGARQLYMADVFDVSSDSRTRKPYGRVFYTKSKSLIFYAFDLDRQPGIKSAAFQVWGRNESSQGRPVNLGILFQDSEQNRRWVLRFDDPQQLAEIDAVFVTVEPHGGSNKPTSKPFLYASLRREPNHP